MITLRISLLVLALAACGGEQKQAGPDAKAPDAGKTAATTPQTPAATPPAGADKVKVVEGAEPGDDRYALRVEPPSDAAVGREGVVKVSVVPKQPWHMNLDFPTKLAVTAPEGVNVVKAEQAKADALKLDENSAEFAVKFTPSSAGDKSFAGEFKFAVCQDEACSPVTEKVEFKVAVK